MVRLNATLVSFLPKIKIDYSPLDQLIAYESRMQSLVTLFYIVGAPMILLSLIFISLTSSIAIQQLEQETVTMRGRGMSLSLMFLQNLAESLFLICVASPFAVFFGWLSANMIGRTRSFLQFTSRSNFTYSLKDINLLWFCMLSLFIVIARLLPLLSLKHTTVVKVKQERSRSSTKPFWQRVYLDFMLVIPTGYAYWRLRHQLSQLKILTVKIPNHTQTQYDPLQFIASSLFIIAACMVVLRVFPLFLRILRSVIDRGFPVGPFLAVQEVARRPQAHYNVMLLIMISISIAIFSTSMAKTLNQWIIDSQYYQTGADLVIKEYEIPLNSGNPYNSDTPTQNSTPVENGVESLIDLQKHLQIPGIRSATFVGKYNGSFDYGTGRKDCILMGIDRLSFSNTAYYRSDFASLPLGTLLNYLAEQPNGVLVSQSLLESTGLKIGDHFRATAPIGLYKQGFNKELIIVGAYKYFPTIFPTDVSTLIVNTETLFGYPEAATGYDVWLNIQRDSNVQNILKNLKSMALIDQLLVDVRGNALQQIQKLTTQPEWLGLFGILSVGFLLTGLLPCIGFILDSFASIRKNFIQLGILQAIGLSIYQMINYLVLERLLFVAVALACGVGIGFLASILFVPLLQITIAPGTPVPPFQVLIGWSEANWLTLSFSVIFLIAIIGTIGYMIQIKIFQAVKMGESI
jgi:putative ABC transport system permease protein